MFAPRGPMAGPLRRRSRRVSPERTLQVQTAHAPITTCATPQRIRRSHRLFIGRRYAQAS